jgi:hypothetical protein
MTRDEALDQAFALFGLDEFQRIAAADILRDLEGESWPPAPDSKHEQKLMELGALVSESWEPPYPGGPLASRKAPE